jgi:hypothetical protein
MSKFDERISSGAVKSLLTLGDRLDMVSQQQAFSNSCIRIDNIPSTSTCQSSILPCTRHFADTMVNFFEVWSDSLFSGVGVMLFGS